VPLKFGDSGSFILLETKIS